MSETWAPDAITVEVIGSALATIADEMVERIVRSAYSTNIKERRDCSAAVFDRGGRILAQAECIPIHLGSLIGIVTEIQRRRSDLQAGDVFLANDPYAGAGTHLPDMVVAAPLVEAGEVRGFVANVAHHSDFVDMGTAHIFQEGLRIPPVRIIRAGRVQDEMLELVLANTRLPDQRRADFRAQLAASELGLRSLGRLHARYGTPLLQAASDALLDYTEERTRAGIRSIAPGEYAFRDAFDFDETLFPIPLQVTVRVQRDGEIEIDLRGNPPQVRSTINLPWLGLLATVYYAVKAFVDPYGPPNAGLFRPIRVLATEGTIVNSCDPAAVGNRSHIGQRVVDLIHGALAQACPERATAAHNGANTAQAFSGTDPRTGRFYAFIETLGGGFGARATRDGLDGVQVHLTNTSNPPVEVIEIEYPLMVERYELVPDSGGDGEYRGGMGLLRQIRVVGHEARFRCRGSRRETSPWGLAGGGPGSRGSVSIRDAAEDDPREPSRCVLGPGESIVVVTPGSGGYGDPDCRDPDRRETDRREGRTSVS
jgi:N-methylhydantoinase B